MNALKLAIIGSGPSAFYVASRLFKLLPEASNLRVHLYDKLWAPYGLVRYGVAPDHPEVKNCVHKFEQTALDPRFQFFGNVEIVSRSPPTIPTALPVSLASLFKTYTHVLFATGCGQPKLHASLPPDAPWCVPALDLVHWYTQHPGMTHFHNSPPPLDKIKHVTLIGNGNVSLDIARMLLMPIEHLSPYDVPQDVLDVLATSKVEHVAIVGRRGPLEAAFTMKELREMMQLPDSSFVSLDAGMLEEASRGQPFLNDKGESVMQPLSRQQKRSLDLLKKGSKNPYGTTKKSWSLQFFRAPTGYVLSPSIVDHASVSPPPSPVTLSFSHTTLSPATHAAVASSETSTLQTDMVITSLGFHGTPTTPYYDPGLGHLRTTSGQVISPTGEVVDRVYASGWAAMGAKGVLGSTMVDAFAVAHKIATDWRAGQETTVHSTGESHVPTPLHPSHLSSSELSNPVPEVIEALKKGDIVTQYDEWRRIDEEEVRRGQVMGKERERMPWTDVKRFLGHN